MMKVKKRRSVLNHKVTNNPVKSNAQPMDKAKRVAKAKY